MNEQYTMYQLAYHLVKQDHFNVLHINSEEQEIWLERYENKTSHVVRLIHSGFDWKNHLKRDIAIVFQKVKAMNRFLKGKNIQVHNVYLSSHTPVDDWESLKKPMQLKERNPIKMNVYYLDEHDKQDELIRLGKDINSSLDGQIGLSDETGTASEQQIHYYKDQLTETLHKKKREVETVFSNGKPFITYLLIIVNILMFLILELNGDSTSTQNLIDFGAKYNPAIIDGEWWRIITSTFLHIGLLHLFMNMLAVYYLGSTVERIYGSWRFAVVYFLAGIGGGIASFAMTTNVSAGASGAIFGLFGALLYFGLLHKKIFFQTMGMGILVLIGVNIIFGAAMQQIDDSAHIGGLITGFIASAIVSLPKKKLILSRIGALIVYIGIIVGLILVGFQNNNASYQLTKINELINQGNYAEVIEHATKGLEDPGELGAHLLFQRSYAYIKLGKTDLAIKDLEHAIQLTDKLPEAYYNLAMLYYNTGNQNKAEEMIKKATELKPDDDSFQQLYEEITGQKSSE